MRHDAASPATDRERIIELFAKRQPTYTRSAILHLLRITDAALDEALRVEILTPEHNDIGETVFRWEDVAHLALEQWTPRMIQAALDQGHDAIPHLNQHRIIQVSLPIHLIRYLDYRAREESRERLPRNASGIIEDLLHNHVGGSDLHAIDAQIQGFMDAVRYPYYTPRTNTLLHRCRYCDTSITEPSREVCRACETRHEPREHLGEYGIPELAPPARERSVRATEKG